jgi:hypothetical protein
VVIVSGISGRPEEQVSEEQQNKFQKMDMLAKQLVENGYDNVDQPSYERYPN